MLLACHLMLVNQCSIEETRTLKVIGKLDFSSFWQDLGFGACFFTIKILIKK